MFQHFKTLAIVFVKKRFVSPEYLVTSNSMSGRPWWWGADFLVKANVKTARTKCQFYNTKQEQAAWNGDSFMTNKSIANCTKHKKDKGWQHFSLPNVHLSQRYRRVGGGGGHLPLIGRGWSRDPLTGLWLVEADYSVAGWDLVMGDGHATPRHLTVWTQRERLADIDADEDSWMSEDVWGSGNINISQHDDSRE